VVGARDHKLREYLVDVDDLDLMKCIQKAKQYTSSRAQVSHMSKEDNLDAVAVRGRDRGLKPDQVKYEFCYFCGKENHPREKCPARESKCNRCRETGHWARGKVCKGKKKDARKLQAVSDELSCEVSQALYLGSVSE
jgi:hypothetical protein